MLYKTKVFGVPLLPHQYYVAGVVTPPRTGYNKTFYYDGAPQHVIYDLQPYWKNLVDGGKIAANYCVEELPDKGICVLIPRRHDSFARGVAALMGMDILVTSKPNDLVAIRELLMERGARYTETIPFLDDRETRAPFNLDDPDLEIATEIKMTFPDIEVRKSKLPLLVSRQPLGEVVELGEHLVEAAPA